MIPKGNSKANIDRFLGFQEAYDRYRPEAPMLITKLLTQYLGRNPQQVVDIGCGTGLSTFLWKDAAQSVIGIEPNPDMLSKAVHKLSQSEDAESISFVQGFSNALDLADESTDIVTCSQSFHWMEPVSTLKEVSRILRKGGIFAAYDCDWPLMLQPDIELQYNRLIRKADDIVANLVSTADQAHKWDKEGHLQRIQASGAFSFSREIVFHTTEVCDAERYIGLTLSQGGVQTVLKLNPTQIEQNITEFRNSVDAYFQGRSLEILLSYRMRIGIK